MTFPGPLSISPLNATNSPAGQELGLRVFQRVTAQILNVSGMTAVLTIEGYPVVAQLASSDQAAALLSRRTAQFVVTRLTDQVITLKFVNGEPPAQAKAAGAVVSGPELAVRLLEQHQLPVTVNNLMMARSVLKQHLPVTPRLLDELLAALSELGGWGSSEAELAAALKAAGLPLSGQSLALAARPAAQTGVGLANLIDLLSKAAGRDFPPELLAQLKDSLRLLRGVALDGEGESSRLAEQLKQAVRLLGRSVESILLEESQNSRLAVPEKGLLSLLGLRQALEQAGEGELSGAIDKFLGDTRHHQFLNIKPDPALERGKTVEIGFLIQPGGRAAQEKSCPARLRVDSEPGPDSAKNDPALTNLRLQVEIHPGETVEVQLVLSGRQIRTEVTAPDAAWCRQAQEESASLAQAFQALGYSLKEFQLEIGQPQMFEDFSQAGGDAPLMAVDIQV